MSLYLCSNIQNGADQTAADVAIKYSQSETARFIRRATQGMICIFTVALYNLSACLQH